MGLFSKILDKLGLNKKPVVTPAAPTPASVARPVVAPAAPIAKPTPTPVAPPTATPVAKPIAAAISEPAAPVAAAPAPQAISEVDVVEKLEGLGKGTELNWKASIVDLLKLLGIDSSREARDELAQELGCPAELMSDSAKMNAWLHKAVLKKIAENGGNIPKELLD
jgi:hypothetical protein